MFRAARGRHIINMEITYMDTVIDYILCAAECVLSLVLAGLVLSLPAVSCLQAITSGGVVLVVVGSVLLIAVVLAYALITYAAVTAVRDRVHYLY